MWQTFKTKIQLCKDKDIILKITLNKKITVQSCKYICLLQLCKQGAGETAQQLRALEDPSSIPSTYVMMSHNYLQPRDLMLSPGFVRHPYTCKKYPYIYNEIIIILKIMPVAKNNNDTHSWVQSYLVGSSFSPHATSALRQKQNRRRDPPGPVV